MHGDMNAKGSHGKHTNPLFRLELGGLLTEHVWELDWIRADSLAVFHQNAMFHQNAKLSGKVTVCSRQRLHLCQQRGKPRPVQLISVYCAQQTEPWYLGTPADRPLLCANLAILCAPPWSLCASMEPCASARLLQGLHVGPCMHCPALQAPPGRGQMRSLLLFADSLAARTVVPIGYRAMASTR